MAQYGFYFDATRCTGCKTCEAACRDYYDLPIEQSFRHVYELEGGQWSENEDGTWKTDSYTYYLSFSCSHCDNAACMKVCPTGAMHRDENGLVSVDDRRCIGCGYCELACPYGNPKVDRDQGHSVKCDGCAERTVKGLVPICVEACPMRAIEFGPIDDIPQGNGLASIAPLPDSSATTPNYYVQHCKVAQPSGSTACIVSTPAEVE